MTKVGFISLGCPKNLVDSEVMMGLLSREGYELTPRADDAEILVVNTCSFIESAQKESIETILEMAEHKKFGAAKKLVVAGCLVERFRDQILEQVPEVDAVVGTGEVERIIEAVQGDLKVLPAQPPSFLYHDFTPRIVTTPKHQAYIKIAEGCDHPCTFCIIPQLRGNFRSRRFASVIREAENLAAAGAREITLIGQDTTSYGEDLGLRDGLAQLLEKLAQVEDLLWVRFLYAYPNRVTQKMLETIAAHPRLAKYIDMPLQHASRNVLARMKRGSHGDAFLKLLDRMRSTIPSVALRTSFIVGFPGESSSDFQILEEFINEAKFDWLGVFSYSDEDGSAAYHLGDKVPLREIERRRKKLMQIQRQISKKNKRKLVGREFDVLALGPSEETDLLWEGRAEMHAPEIDGKLFINDFGGHEELVPGTFYRCEITEAHDYDLVARIVG
jgi:ribosomal protein S12 methylthiotransferase